MLQIKWVRDLQQFSVRNLGSLIDIKEGQDLDQEEDSSLAHHSRTNVSQKDKNSCSQLLKALVLASKRHYALKIKMILQSIYKMCLYCDMFKNA